VCELPRPVGRSRGQAGGNFAEGERKSEGRLLLDAGLRQEILGMFLEREVVRGESDAWRGGSLGSGCGERGAAEERRLRARLRGRATERRDSTRVPLRSWPRGLGR